MRISGRGAWWILEARNGRKSELIGTILAAEVIEVFLTSFKRSDNQLNLFQVGKLSLAERSQGGLCYFGARVTA